MAEDFVITILHYLMSVLIKDNMATAVLQAIRKLRAQIHIHYLLFRLFT
jgi:hypothetical protein